LDATEIIVITSNAEMSHLVRPLLLCFFVLSEEDTESSSEVLEVGACSENCNALSSGRVRSWVSCF